MPSVVFSPAARAELLEARDWYAARDVELADRFIVEIETIVERIGTEPQQFPVVYQDIRRARCRRYELVPNSPIPSAVAAARNASSSVASGSIRRCASST